MPGNIVALRGNPGRLTKAELAARGNGGGLDVPAKLPAPPPHLSKAARAEYRRTGKALLALGLVTVLDRGVLTMYATTLAHWEELQRAIADLPAEAKSDAMGLLLRRMADKQARLALTLGRLLGCTPASRLALQPGERPPPPRGGNGWDQFGA